MATSVPPPPPHYFDSQEAALCGIHAINNLLGEPKLYFNNSSTT